MKIKLLLKSTFNSQNTQKNIFFEKKKCSIKGLVIDKKNHKHKGWITVQSNKRANVK